MRDSRFSVERKIQMIHYATMGIKSRNKHKGSILRGFRLSKLCKGVELVST